MNTRYQVVYPVSGYTFPREALIHNVNVDDSYIVIELTDGRILSIPLWWIPTLYNTSPDEWLKFTINRSRTMIIWDPEQGSINDEIRVEDYLSPRPSK